VASDAPRGPQEKLEIRSYRRVFDLERRIYRVDRLRLNPGGIPVRGIVYFLALVSLALAVGRIPSCAALVAWTPWYVRDLIVPAVAASLLTALRIGGRPFHLAAHALTRFLLTPRKHVSLRPRGAMGERGSHWFPPALLMLPDGSDCGLRAFRYAGPGALRVSVAHECVPHSRSLLPWRRRPADLIVRRPRAATASRRDEVIVLERGACVEVR
jgi:hypothetical protein